MVLCSHLSKKRAVKYQSAIRSDCPESQISWGPGDRRQNHRSEWHTIWRYLQTVGQFFSHNLLSEAVLRSAFLWIWIFTTGDLRAKKFLLPMLPSSNFSRFYYQLWINCLSLNLTQVIINSIWYQQRRYVANYPYITVINYSSRYRFPYKDGKQFFAQLFPMQ
jgi:hypothetical protein